MTRTPQPSLTRSTRPSTCRAIALRFLQCVLLAVVALVALHRVPPGLSEIANQAGTARDAFEVEGLGPGSVLHIGLALADLPSLEDEGDTDGAAENGDDEGDAGEPSSESDNQDDVAFWSEPPYLGPPSATVLCSYETCLNGIVVRSRVPRPSERA